MADPVASIYAYMDRQADRTAQTFGAIQQSIVQTRTMQLREQQQAWDNTLTLKKLDIAEKQNTFDNVLALRKLGLAERELGFNDLMNAERLKSQSALTAYREAQTAKLTAQDTAAGYIDYPVNGTSKEWMGYGEQVDTGAASVAQEWDPALQTAIDQTLNETPTSEDDPDLGYSLFAEPATDAAGGPSMAPKFSAKGMSNLTTSAVMGAQAAQAQAPTSNFDAVAKRINQTIGFIQNSDKPQGVKLAEARQLQGNLMRIASTEYAQDPKARAFLNDNAPERSAVEAAAARGDESTARQLMNGSQQRLGYLNPVLADAYENGSRKLAAQQEQKALRDELKDLYGIKDADGMQPEWVKTRIDQLSSQLYGTSSPTGLESRANSLRPAVR